MAMPVHGGSPTTLASGQAGGPDAIATDGVNVYWVNNTGSGGATSSVRKVPVVGGPTVTLATGLVTPNSIAVDARNVYWGEGSGAPTPTAGDAGAPCVKSLPVQGGVATTLVSSAPPGPLGIGFPPGVAVFDPAVYAAFRVDAASLGLVRIAAAGGTPLTLAPDGDPNLAVDGISVYWTVSETSSVFKVSVSGGTPIVVASGQSGPGAIAVNDESAFWTVANDGNVYGAIMKAPK
jgi:hypothetical protein